MTYRQMDDTERQRLQIYINKKKSNRRNEEDNLDQFFFVNLDLRGVELREADLTGEYLNSVNLSGANLSNATLKDVRLWGADLSNAILVEACLDGASLCDGVFTDSAGIFPLSGANLSQADLSNATLWGSNLSNANLSEAKLNNTYLGGAYLIDANLSEANLTAADLGEANLSGADLSGANLSRTNLLGANLSRANLSNANLQEADYLDYAYLKDTVYNNATQFPQDFSPEVAGMVKAELQDVFLEAGLLRVEPLNDIYEHVLTGICNFKGIGSEDEDSLSLYLQSLKPYARRLWQSYRSSSVEVNYRESDAQAAYFIRYYPYYAQMTREVLESLHRDALPFESSHVQACFFGAGPAPETIGLINYLNNNFPNVTSVQVQTYDIAADTWWISRDITRNYLVPCYWQGQFILNADIINLGDSNALYKIINVIKNSSLFVVQNCLNEVLTANADIFLDNISFLVSEMPQRSILVIADQNNYFLVLNLMKRIEDCIRGINQASIIRSHTAGSIGFDARIALPPIPRIIRENLLTGEDQLIPRRRVSFNYLVVQKALPEIS